MDIIKNEIKLEQSKQKPNLHYLKVLDNLLIKNEVTFEDFSGTGNIVPIDYFMKNYLCFELHDECTDVIVYLCGFKIQMLKSGEYFFKHPFGVNNHVTIQNKSLDILEILAWNNFIGGYFKK